MYLRRWEKLQMNLIFCFTTPYRIVGVYIFTNVYFIDSCSRPGPPSVASQSSHCLTYYLVLCLVDADKYRTITRTSTQPAEPKLPCTFVSTAGITSSFVDSGGDDANFLADEGETIRLERAALSSSEGSHTWNAQHQCQRIVNRNEKGSGGPGLQALWNPVSGPRPPKLGSERPQNSEWGR